MSRTTFSPELVDATIFVIDVAEGDKIPRKGGPGITRSDLLVINKIDLAPYVGASLEVMERDSRKMRGDKPFLFTNIREKSGLDPGKCAAGRDRRMKNQFGKTSELRITAEGTEGRTRLADVYFTAPFKVMEPFPLKGGLQVMLLSASAGVMAGDEQKFW